jgi:ComF family protein
LKRIETLKRACLEGARTMRDALYPATCLQCGDFFHPDSQDPENISADVLFDSRIDKLFQRLLGAYLCRPCAERFQPVASPLCPSCGVVFESKAGGDHVCEACLRNEKPFGMARACGIFDGALMAAVHAFKYGEKVRLSLPLSKLLMAAFLKFWRQRRVDLIVPVPLHARRLRERGFNQAYLLVRHWASALKTPGFPVQDIEIGRRVLKRIRWTPPQTGLGRRERQANIKKAFALSAPEAVRDCRVLVVDDVYTTGATVGECARVLIKGGAREVDVLTLARTM